MRLRNEVVTTDLKSQPDNQLIAMSLRNEVVTTVTMPSMIAK